jgi:hypothetical protein
MAKRLCEREPDAGVSIQVAVGEVMNNLPRGPAVLAIWPIESTGWKSGERRIEFDGQRRDL